MNWTRTRGSTPKRNGVREEAYLGDAALVLIFEGELFRVMNSHHAECVKLQHDLEQFVRCLGYFFELGHAWSMGFYPLPAAHPHPGLRIWSNQTLATPGDSTVPNVIDHYATRLADKPFRSRTTRDFRIIRLLRLLRCYGMLISL